MNLLHGEGFYGTGKEGNKTFEWPKWNLPLPGMTTRKKNTRSGYTREWYIHHHLHESFLKLASETSPLYESDRLLVNASSLQ